MRISQQEDLDFGKRFARSQYTFISGKTKQQRISYYKIKNFLKYPDLCQAADFIDKNILSRYKDLMFGNPLPQSYEDLGVCESSILAENFITEINWTLLSIRKYSYEINLFLIYKEEYEKNLLLANYDEAERYISKIENEICYSLWTLENRFLLKEFQNKSSENKDLLIQFNASNKSTGYTISLANYLSNRAEKTLSVTRFNSELQLALSKLDGNRKKEHIDYYLFKLSFLNNLNFTKFSEIISYDFQHSIIDRYLNLRKVFSLLLTRVDIKSNKVEESEGINGYIINRLNYLLKKLNDPILNKLKLFAGDKIFSAFIDDESSIEIGIIDKYTTGIYNDVEVELQKYLLLKPSKFDLYILYVKSLIYQNKNFQPIGNQRSLQNQILSDMYKIISATGSPDSAALNLLRVANNLTNCVISYGITDFVINRTRGQRDRELFAKLSYNLANPIIYEVLENKESQINYLTFLKKKFPESISIDFLLSKLNGYENISKFEKAIPEAKYKSELARAFQADSKFDEAAKIWEYIVETNIITPILESAIKNLFICYEELKNYDACIKLYVDSYFTNKFLVNKIEVNTLIKKIKENRFRVVTPNIELPIFYTICNADENELHTAFEKFNISNEVCKPSELIPKFSDFPFNKIVYYLKLTCKLELLRHSTNINGSRERLEERLFIIQFLKDKDLENKDNYDGEIKYISNILVIQKGLIDLDDGKIYVNEFGILSNELKEYEAIYKRFQIIAGLKDNNNSLLLIKEGKLTQLNYSNESARSEKIEYSNNPVFDIYIEMFDAIKEKFLYSKDGIVAYLSTRIRHGVLLGEIRPVYEKHKLITQKEGDTSVYRRNYHWDQVYQNESPFVNVVIQNLLKDFSYSVDGLIHDLIKKHLQVYDPENNKDGWFNYDFETDKLFWHSVRALKSNDFAHFVKQVFEILWDRTDDNLSLIRSNIETKVLQQFNELFNNLEKDLIEKLGVATSQKIVVAIKACSTEAQTVISRISSWFNRSGTSASDFQLENIIDIVMGYADKNKRVRLQKQIDCNSTIKGIYLKHFADLLWMFTENILKHSDEKAPKINAMITTSRINDILEIKIENEITSLNSIAELKDLGVEKGMDINKLLSEGKSGFHKAYKILKYDLLNENNYLLTQLNDNEKIFTVIISINLKELLS